MDYYAYERLPAESTQVRIAHIQPGKFDDGIVLFFEVVDLEPQKKLDYCALSYAWGSSAPDQPVVVRSSSEPTNRGSDRRLTITTSLDEAIRYLRREDQTFPLWADALCINQADDLEKSHQVAMMGEIYRHAPNAVVWLGTRSENSDEAIRILQNIGQNCELDTETGRVRSIPNGTDPVISKMDEQMRLAEDDLASIFHLFNRPYFTRLWIRQEVSLATGALVVICGRSSIEWQTFRNAWGFLHFQQWQKTGSKFDLSLSQRLDKIYDFVVHGMIGPEYMLRRTFEDTICSEPRDRIFAVLRLLPGDIQRRIRPNYSRSVAETYLDLVVASFEERKNLYVLSECYYDPSSALPSWIPDWHRALPRYSRNWYSYGGFRAEWILSRKDYRLTVHGKCLGKVANIQTDKLTATSTVTNFKTVVGDLLETKSIHEEYPTGGTYITALVTVMAFGNFRRLFEPVADSLPEFRDELLATEKFWRKGSISEKDGTADSEYVSDHINYIKYLANMTLFSTTNGLIGAVPAVHISIEKEDEIWALVGTRDLFLVRKAREDYRIIVACYVYGYTYGEAFLGSLQSSLEWVWINNGQGMWNLGTRNTSTGALTEGHPRVEELNRQQPGVALDTNLLRTMGVDVEPITFV